MRSPYRYTLSRTWDERKPRWLWVCLNPLPEDPYKPSLLTSRLTSFTTDGGGGGWFLAHLYAWRASKPEDLFMMPEAQRIGPRNDLSLLEFAQDAQKYQGRIVAAWGAHPKARGRSAEVLKILRRYRTVHCLGLTKAGFPRHPLYVPGAVQIVQLPA